MPPHSPQCKIQMPRRHAWLSKKWGKDLAVCFFSTTFVCKLHTYLDMKTMNRLLNMAHKGVKLPPQLRYVTII